MFSVGFALFLHIFSISFSGKCRINRERFEPKWINDSGGHPLAIRSNFERRTGKKDTHAHAESTLNARGELSLNNGFKHRCTVASE